MRRRAWRVTRLALAIVAALLVGLSPGLTPRVALAHAELVGSTPEVGATLQSAPATVRLSFTEPIERDFFALEVYAADRQRVDRRNARIPPDSVQALEVSPGDLGPGIHTVVWRILSIDSHVVRGVFTFSVGVPGQAAGTATLPPGLEAGGTPFPLGATVRWLTFLAVSVLTGGFAFAPLVLWPALGATGVAGPPAAQRATRRFLWVAWPAAGALLVLSLAALLLQGADASGQPLGEVLGGRAASRLLSGTKYGALWLARAGAVVALLFAVALVAVEARPRTWSRWLGFGVGAALLLVLASTGHASAVARRTALAVGADWIHLLAGAVWVGGLVQLAIALAWIIHTR